VRRSEEGRERRHGGAKKVREAPSTALFMHLPPPGFGPCIQECPFTCTQAAVVCCVGMRVEMG